MIPGVNIISGKARAAGVNGAEGSGGTLSSLGRFLGGGGGGGSTVRTFLDSKLLFKTTNSQKINVNERTHIQC